MELGKKVKFESLSLQPILSFSHNNILITEVEMYFYKDTYHDREKILLIEKSNLIMNTILYGTLRTPIRL